MYSEADGSITQMAMDVQKNRHYAGDENLFVTFHILPMEDRQASVKEGRPIYKDVEHIRIMQPGNKNNIVDRPVTEMDKARFPKHYAAWKQEGVEVFEGTPLEAWPQVTRAQVEELKYFGIRTVEQLAAVTDTNAQNVKGVALLRERAKVYVNVARDQSAVIQMQEESRQKDLKIEALSQAVEELKVQIQALQQTPKPPPRGRKT